MESGTSPEPSYIRDLSRQWVLPNPSIFGCSFGFLLSRCSPADRIILAIMDILREDKNIARVSFCTQLVGSIGPFG